MIRKKVLIVDDDPDILDLLDIILKGEGFDVLKASNGEEALQKIQKQPPDLLITDFKMPKLDGDEVCKSLRKDILLRHMPIIMLTGKSEVRDKVYGIDAGADDYIVKPFQEEELLARVKMVLRRTEDDLDANPLTRLPGNVSIIHELEKRLHNNEDIAAFYVDLDKFKIYNDRYGFEYGDGIIRETARLLIAIVKGKGNPDDFIGHIGGDDFVIISKPDKVKDICKKIIEEFKKISPNFYSEEDRKKGFIKGKDRRGNIVKSSLLTISIGVVTNTKRNITHVAEIGEIGAELKEYAKLKEGNTYIIDRRGK